MNGKRIGDAPMPWLFERIEQLRAEAGGKIALADAIGLRQLIRRHVEGAEDQVEKRKSRGKILLPSPFRHGVMPAVKNRTSDDVLKGPERPIQIGVHEGGMGDGEGA